MDWSQVKMRRKEDGRVDTCWGWEVPNYPPELWEQVGTVEAAKPAKAAKSAPAVPADKAAKKAAPADKGDPVNRLPLDELNEMKMNDVTAYAKNFGINTYGRKKVEVIQDIVDTESYSK